MSRPIQVITPAPPGFGAEVEFLRHHAQCMRESVRGNCDQVYIYYNDEVDKFGLGDIADIVTAAAREAGFEGRLAKTMRYETPEFWTSKYDGNNHEVTTPVLEAAVNHVEMFGRTIQNIGRLLERAGVRNSDVIHSNAGFHVHVGMGKASDEQVINLVRVMWYVECVLLQLAGPARAGRLISGSNGRPGSFATSEFHHTLNRMCDSRVCEGSARPYCGGAICCFRSGKPTMEIRFAQCTFDATDNSQWVKLLLMLGSIGLGMNEEFPLIERDATTDLLMRFLDEHIDLITPEFQPEVSGVKAWITDRSARMMAADRQI